MALYDVWSDDSGNVTATPADQSFVDDSDAPYPYAHHEIRVEAASARKSMAEYRSIKAGITNGHATP